MTAAEPGETITVPTSSVTVPTSSVTVPTMGVDYCRNMFKLLCGFILETLSLLDLGILTWFGEEIQFSIEQYDQEEGVK